MKKRILFIFSMLIMSSLNAQVGINTDTPQATLDVQGKPTDKNELDGVIPPRITGTQLKAKDYTNKQIGAIVYATEADPSPSGQTLYVTLPGYYYFDGNYWVALDAEKLKKKCVYEPDDKNGFDQGDNGTQIDFADYSFRWYTNRDNSYSRNQIDIYKRSSGDTQMISKSLGGNNLALSSFTLDLPSNEWKPITENINVDGERHGEVLVFVEPGSYFKLTLVSAKLRASSTASFCYAVEKIF